MDLLLVVPIAGGLIMLFAALYIRYRESSAKESWVKPFSHNLWKSESDEEFMLNSGRIRVMNVLFGLPLAVVSFVYMIPTWASYITFVWLPLPLCIGVTYILLFFSFAFLIAIIRNTAIFNGRTLALTFTLLWLIFIANFWLPQPVIGIDGKVIGVIGYRMKPDYIIYTLLGEGNSVIVFLFIYALIPAIMIAVTYLVLVARRRTGSQTLDVTREWKK